MTSSHHSRLPSTPPRRHRWRGIALGALAVTLSTTLLAQDSIVTNASWNDEEWVHGAVGTVLCGETTDAFATQSTGKALGGSLLGIDLDNLAEVKGVTTRNEAGVATSTGGTEIKELQDAWADPLDVVALSAVELGLTDFLELPLDTSTGAVNQFAQATGKGLAYGASGYVNDSGGIDLPGAEGDYPQLATLKLSEVLDSDLLGGLDLAAALANVADLELEVGAVAARAELDTCASLWEPQVQALARSIVTEEVPGLSREYLATSADLVFTSPTVGALVTAIGGTPDAECGDEDLSVITDLECTVNRLTGPEGVVGTLKDGITNLLLDQLTGGLGLGKIDLDLTATVDTNPIRVLLNHTLNDGVISISLASGEIRIATAALLESAYPEFYSNGLNGLAPNTNPLADPQVLDTLGSRVTSLLTNWVTLVETTLDAVVDSVNVHLLANVYLTLETRVRLLDIIDLDILNFETIGHLALEVNCQTDQANPPGCTLSSLLDPEAPNPVTADFELLPELTENVTSTIRESLGPWVAYLLGSLVSLVVDDIIGGLVSTVIPLLIETLVNGVGNLLGTVIEGALSGVQASINNVSALAGSIIATVTTLYRGLFLKGVVAITINAQNLTPAEDNEPAEWSKHPEGLYEVSAIRVGILDALGDYAVYLHLGRASVGPGCSVNSTNSECPRIHAGGN